MTIHLMDREKKVVKETLTPKVPKKGKTQLFKEAYDQARGRKLQATRKRLV
jgi:hypothetical protein